MASLNLFLTKNGIWRLRYSASGFKDVYRCLPKGTSRDQAEAMREAWRNEIATIGAGFKLIPKGKRKRPPARRGLMRRLRGRDDIDIMNAIIVEKCARFGMSAEQSLALVALQQYACAICRRPMSLTDQRFICTDHCHTKRHLRGLLCGLCNIGLGAFKDSPDRLRAALVYLASPPAFTIERAYASSLTDATAGPDIADMSDRRRISEPS
jgi:hypothetical protein